MTKEEFIRHFIACKAGRAAGFFHFDDGPDSHAEGDMDYWERGRVRVMSARAHALRAAMIEASRRETVAATPAARYRWIGVWWRLFALAAADPATPLSYARKQFALAADMDRRPDHYATKPRDVTDWLHSGLGQERDHD